MSHIAQVQIQRIPLVREETKRNEKLWSCSAYKTGVEKMHQSHQSLVFLFDVSLTRLSLASFAAVQSLNSLNDQIAQFMVTRPCSLADEDETFMPGERDTLRKSMTLMRHLLMDAQ
ncbi:kazrin-like isoform X1, partial [Lates japonicus]